MRKYKDSTLMFWAANVLCAFSAAFFLWKVLPCITTAREVVLASIPILTMVAGGICFVLYAEARREGDRSKVEKKEL
jgi:hypothetical protein